ncbi:MAG: hypothetical protein VW268_04250 [Rhodospirillaceae bacterium]
MSYDDRPWDATHDLSLEGEQSRYSCGLDAMRRREQGNGLDFALYY